MTESQENRCHAIIHGHAAAAAAGNAVPIPGVGVAADMAVMTTMAMSLCAVFGGDVSESAAKSMAIAAMKNTMMRQPVRVLTKELSKLIPGLGVVVGPAISVAMVEAAGWTLAHELEDRARATAS